MSLLYLNRSTLSEQLLATTAHNKRTSLSFSRPLPVPFQATQSTILPSSDVRNTFTGHNKRHHVLNTPRKTCTNCFLFFSGLIFHRFANGDPGAIFHLILRKTPSVPMTKQHWQSSSGGNLFGVAFSLSSLPAGKRLEKKPKNNNNNRNQDIPPSVVRFPEPGAIRFCSIDTSGCGRFKFKFLRILLPNQTGR